MKVTVMMATTLDGKIAKRADHFVDWSEKEDKILFRKRTKESGVIIMGVRTFDTIGRPLPGRKNVIMTRKTDRVSDNPDLVFTNDSPKKILAILEKEGFDDIIVAGGEKINSLFATEGLVDELLITISPFVFGSGLSLFDDSIDLNLELKSTEKIGDNSILAHYKIIK